MKFMALHVVHQFLTQHVIDHSMDIITLHDGDLSDSSSLIRIINVVQPDEIYNLAAQSHVQVSFDVPEYSGDVEEESLTIKVILNAGHSMNYHSHKNRDEVWVVSSGTDRTIVDGMEQKVKAGDVVTMQAGCRHTIISESELKLVEIQIGREISVHDKQKYALEY